jgi:hypothetical protein
LKAGQRVGSAFGSKVRNWRLSRSGYAVTGIILAIVEKGKKNFGREKTTVAIRVGFGGAAYSAEATASAAKAGSPALQLRLHEK